jgi:protein SCO1/2
MPSEVSVDSERDTTEHLGAHLHLLNTDFIGLTGTSEQLEKAKQDFGVLAEVDTHSDPEHYLITHSARIYLVDSNAMLQTSYGFGTAREDILMDLKQVIGSS